MTQNDLRYVSGRITSKIEVEAATGVAETTEAAETTRVAETTADEHTERIEDMRVLKRAHQWAELSICTRFALDLYSICICIRTNKMRLNL